MSEPHSDDANLSLLDHLEELRWRILKSLFAFVIACVAGYLVAQYPLEWLTEPLVRATERARAEFKKETLIIDIAEDGSLRLREPSSLAALPGDARIAFHPVGQDTPIRVFDPSGSESPIIYLRPVDPFVVRLKAAMVIGIMLALPVILFQAWAFVAPGLLPREKRLALPLIVAGSLLFPLGAVFAYYLLDVTLLFFAQFVMPNAAVQNDARAYLSFALFMMVAFGTLFEFPLGVILATRTGLVTADWLAHRRGAIFVVLLVTAALITPSGDPVTLVALALPLQILFEISLVVSRLMDRFVSTDTGEAEDDADDGRTPQE